MKSPGHHICPFVFNFQTWEDFVLGQQYRHGRVPRGRRRYSADRKGCQEPAAECYSLYLLAFSSVFSFLLFSFQLSNTGNVALEYTWMAAVEDERAASGAGELPPPSPDGKGLAVSGS